MQKFIDLFAGIGGFHVALKREGMDCVFASEIDKAACAAYEHNFGMRPAGDITLIDASSIPSHDVLCAGFPCQPFSRSGKRDGLDDPRGRLFYEIIRIAKYHRPRLMLLENVKTILTIDQGMVQREIYRELERIGYNLSHVVLNSGDFNIPQKRERVYFVATRKDSPLGFSADKLIRGRGRGRVLDDIILPDSQTSDLVIDRPDICIEDERPQERSLKPIRIGYLNKGGQGERIYSSSGHAITLTADSGGVGHRTGLYWINDKVRRLHVDEAKRVMGFDVKHKVSEGVAGYRQLGNAVSPPMINQIYEQVRVA